MLQPLTLLLLLAGPSACKAETPVYRPQPDPGLPGRQERPQQAMEFYRKRCAACHGPRGAGDGLAARSLAPRPADFSDAAWQRKVSDDHLRRIIVEGGPAVGKAPTMPASPELRTQPQLVAQLISLLRSFQAETQ